MKKRKKKINWILSIIAIVYILALVFPQYAFANKFVYKNFTVYYHAGEADEEAIKSVLDESMALLKKSVLFNQEKEQRIFVCGSFSEFTFFSPISRKSFAVNYALLQNIFLSESSFSENRILRNSDTNNRRTLSAVIAHETTHSLLEDKLGFVKYKLLPSWKNEGYCDHIAQEGSYDEQIGLEEICKGSKDKGSMSFTYFKYKKYADYLLDVKGVNVEEFLKNDFTLEELDVRLIKAYCDKSSQNESP